MGESKDVALETFYQQYLVRYSAGDENAIINARFRFADNIVTTLDFSKPCTVQFEGVDLSVDSTYFKGGFY